MTSPWSNPTPSTRPQRDEAHRLDASRLDARTVHDLINPMTGVLGQLEMLEELLDTNPAADVRQRVSDCAAAARELSEMLVDLRALAQLDAGEQTYQPQPVSVAALLRTLTEHRLWPADALRYDADPGHSAMSMWDSGALAGRALRVVAQMALRLSSERSVTLAADRTGADRIAITCRYVGKPLPEPLGRSLWTPQFTVLQRDYGIRIDRARGIELVREITQFLDGSARYEPTDDGGAFVLTFPSADEPGAGGP